MFDPVGGAELTTQKASCCYIRSISTVHPPDFSALSTPSTPRSVRDYHRGNGALRGGGLQKVRDTGPSMKAYKQKLDHRLGTCILACLLTIAVVLTIYGIFHERPHDELTTYITATKKMIVDSLPPPTTTDASTALLSENMIVTDNGTEIYSTSPLTEPDTCLGSEDVDRIRCLTVPELDEHLSSLHGSHIVLWNLVAMNIIIAMLLIPLTCLFFSDQWRSNKNYKLFYRIAMLLALLFMAVQLIFLISPLFTSAYFYPSMVDKLLVDKLPRDQNLINNLESSFGCEFDYIPQLVSLNMQEPCLPKIKNSLLPTYTVVLLIVIALLPFAFIVFTYAWDAWIKDSSVCSGARRRIELNNQQRPQSREDILKRTMEEPQYV